MQDPEVKNEMDPDGSGSETLKVTNDTTVIRYFHYSE